MNATAQPPISNPRRVPLSVHVVTLTVVIVPFLGVVAAAVLLWDGVFTGIELGLLVGMYLLSILGLTVGFHRLFSHRAFETNATVKFILTALGSMAIEAPLLKWVAVHRLHHLTSDTHDDPHSPHHRAEGIKGLLRGVWHAHMGWFFKPDPENLSHYVQDLHRSRAVRVASALFPLWVLLGLVAPAALGGLLTESWTGVWIGLIWGGLVRIFLVHHVTWSVNSACHLWGPRPYQSDDQSRNNLIFAVLALGDGWHNTHHAFPTSARHGLGWWQIDMAYWVIRGLALVGLAWDVRVPTKQAQARKRKASLKVQKAT